MHSIYSNIAFYAFFFYSRSQQIKIAVGEEVVTLSPAAVTAAGRSRREAEGDEEATTVDPTPAFETTQAQEASQEG